jgi:hypothetical protein
LRRGMGGAYSTAAMQRHTPDNLPNLDAGRPERVGVP